MATVTLKNVSKTYISKKEEVRAVRDFNLDVKDGEFMCLLGPSGCGKSSTMRMIVGLEEISGGEIYIGERFVNYLSPQQRNVAMSFETYALYTHLSVKENILFPLRAQKVPEEEMKNRFDRVVSMLDIADLLERGPSQLSGGQQQRVSLARALIREPSVFLLDEPLSHLDVTLRTATRAQIRHLHDELKTTFIYVTHDQLEAISLADRIAVMNFAVLQQVGTREELLDYPKNLFVADFIGEPSINLIECEMAAEKDGLVLKAKDKGFEVPVPKKWEKALREHGKKDYTIGIRPHDIEIGGKKKENHVSITGKVDVFEFLGEENHVTSFVGDSWITSVVGADAFFKEGENIEMYISENRMHIFDSETEECLSTQYKLQENRKDA